jgi:hypothetical protein
VSAVGDAFKALRQVLLMQANIERLEGSVDKIGADLTGLAEAVASLRDRVSRLEGFVDGAAAVAASRKKLRDS